MKLRILGLYLFLGVFCPKAVLAGQNECYRDGLLVLRRPKVAWPLKTLKSLSHLVAPRSLLVAALPFPAPEGLKNWANPNRLKFQTPWIQNTQKWISRVYKVGAWTSLGGVALLATEISRGSSLTVEEYLDQKTRSLAEDEIQLILNPTLVPHIAIRIGNEVFNFGADGFSIQSLELHFLERPLRRQMQTNEPLWSKDTDLIFSDSRQIVTLKLDSARVKKLRTRLSNFSYQSWANWPLIHDCVTLVSKFLSEVGVKIPWVLDSSPSQVFMQFAAQKVLQDRVGIGSESFRITEIGQIFIENKENRELQTAQNLLFNTWESKFMFWTWIYSKGLGRLTFELAKPGTESRIYWNPEIFATLNESILALSEKKLEVELGSLWIDFLIVESENLKTTNFDLKFKIEELSLRYQKIIASEDRDFVDRQMAQFNLTRISKIKFN